MPVRPVCWCPSKYDSPADDDRVSPDESGQIPWLEADGDAETSVHGTSRQGGDDQQ